MLFINWKDSQMVWIRATKFWWTYFLDPGGGYKVKKGFLWGKGNSHGKVVSNNEII